MFFLNVIVACASMYLGLFLGVRECKKEYGIPKGVTAQEGEFVLWADKDEDVANGNILDY